jgi:hypothetical protein
MTTETESTTIESTTEDTVEVPGDTWDEFMGDQDDQDAGAEGTASGESEQESPEVIAAREAAEAAQKALEETQARVTLEQRTAAFRELPEAQRDGWLSTVFSGEKAREDFVEHVESIERQELIDRLLDGDDEALLAGYREAEEILRAEIEDAISDNPDRLRMLISRSQENVVSLPEVETPEGEEPVDPMTRFLSEWNEGPVKETVEDLEAYVTQADIDMKRDRVRVAPEVRDQFNAFIAEADKYPANHSFRVKALEAAAGLASWARAEHEAAIPFGLGGIQQTTRYFGADGQWHQIEVDGFGSKRESVLENAAAPSELGILKDEPAAAESIDYENITAEQAARLSPPQWLELSEKNPELKEQLLRRSSEEMERRHRESGSGGLM